jgi:hypothetical protein
VTAPARVLGGQAEVEADRLGVADVQVAIGLRREPRDDASPNRPLARSSAMTFSMKFVPDASLVAIQGLRAHIVEAARHGRKARWGQLASPYFVTRSPAPLYVQKVRPALAPSCLVWLAT